MPKKKHCGWCTNTRGSTDISFSIIDDDFCQYVPYKMIKFCPFCGRNLEEKNASKASR